MECFYFHLYCYLNVPKSACLLKKIHSLPAWLPPRQRVQTWERFWEILTCQENVFVTIACIDAITLFFNLLKVLKKKQKQAIRKQTLTRHVQDASCFSLQIPTDPPSIVPLFCIHMHTHTYPHIHTHK